MKNRMLKMIHIESLLLSQQLPEFLQKLSNSSVPSSFRQVQFQRSSKYLGFCSILFKFGVKVIISMDSKHEENKPAHTDDVKVQIEHHLHKTLHLSKEEAHKFIDLRIEVDPNAKRSVFANKYAVISTAEVDVILS